MLKSKEGLALLNGTQFMSSWGCYSIIEAERVQKLADFTAAVSVDAFNGQITPFHPAIQKVRNHKGQIESAENVLNFLAGSEIAKQPKNNIQDPYSFRCVPQVHGAVKFAVSQVREVFEREYLITQINRFGGNISRTASFVGMERSALHRKLKSLGVVTTSKAGGRMARLDEDMEEDEGEEHAEPQDKQEQDRERAGVPTPDPSA